nr:NADH dehydrogenase subunit 2 [Cixiidae sp.]
MKLNSSKMIFLTFLILSTLTSLNSNNWLTLWISIEINMFMFLPLLSKKKMKDQPMKYFIIQSTSSSMIMVAILHNSISQTSLSQSMLLMMSMMLKLGMSPMHMWVPSIMSKMTWENCFIMTSILKIPPLILINQMMNFKLLILPLILSLIMGSIVGLKQTSLKKVMAYSSISNSSWMLTSFMLKKSTAMIFISIYFLMNFIIMMTLKKNNLMYMNQMNSKSIKQKMNFMLSMLSISGLPPTIGFFNKWMMLKELMKNYSILPITMILTSTISMFFYLKMTSPYLLNSVSTMKNNKINKINSFLTINILGFPLMYLLKSI